MSYQDAHAPVCKAIEGQVELEIRPKLKDLGEFTVRRVLPASERQMVGPFIFFDHMGPAEFPPGQGIQVRPHPHIGIATITYLFEGEIMHRDSLGYELPIKAGAVNLMTAGKGIVHSERAGSDLDELAVTRMGKFPLCALACVGFILPEPVNPAAHQIGIQPHRGLAVGVEQKRGAQAHQAAGCDRIQLRHAETLAVHPFRVHPEQGDVAEHTRAIERFRHTLEIPIDHRAN